MPDADSERNWQIIGSQIHVHRYTKNGKRKVIRMISRYTAAASVLLFIGVMVYSLYTTQAGEKQYFTAEGTIKKVRLSDGSVVSLNLNTRLAIDESYNDDNREVWLEEGEAFFDVVKNADRPFIVHTQTIVTTVKGTSFNIKAYKALDDNVLAVRSGKVAVTVNDKAVGDFTRNRRLTFHKATGKVEKDVYNWEDAAAWTEGRLVLQSANVEELKLRLEQQFGVSVVFKDGALRGTLLNASYPKGTALKTVLDGIALVYNIKYTVSGNTVTIYN